MKRRFIAGLLSLVFLFSFGANVFACNAEQTDTYVSKILFGNNSAQYISNDKTQMLLDALYICSEQSDKKGQDKLDFLKEQNVWGVPSISDVNIYEKNLLVCSHNSWEYIDTNNRTAQKKRKKVLENTVNKVFDINFFSSEWDKKKADSFAELLYYSHILCDYISDDPANTEVSFKNYNIKSYSGKPYIELNGNVPEFSFFQKLSRKPFVNLSPLDDLERCGVAYALVSKETLAKQSRDKVNIGPIRPTGWTFDKYPGIISNKSENESKSASPYLYNRSHLIARMLAEGQEPRVNTKINLITGTDYMNKIGMLHFENEVKEYLTSKKGSNNHVLYRVTPVYIGKNNVASGVQMEAYSLEDSGKGVCFNVFCYNVQPGININYSDGTSSCIDVTFENDIVLPFVVNNPSDSNPDLIYAINKQLEIIFDNQKNKTIYSDMMAKINRIGSDARKLQGSNEKNKYIKLKEYEYEYLDTLCANVPLLLRREDLFKNAFE